MFHCKVGLFDHTLGIGASIAAAALGATVIEKHFTFSRADGGINSAFSMEPAEMAQLVRESQAASLGLGLIRYGPTPAEEKSLVFRRSLYVAQNMEAGEIFTPENVRVVRPGKGLSPRYHDTILCKRARKALVKGIPLNWDLVG